MKGAGNKFLAPISPVTRTVESVGATLDRRESTVCRAEEFPTISSNIDALSISSRRATFSSRSLSSVCLRSSMSVPLRTSEAPSLVHRGSDCIAAETNDIARLYGMPAVRFKTAVHALAPSAVRHALVRRHLDGRPGCERRPLRMTGIISDAGPAKRRHNEAHRQEGSYYRWQQ